MKYREVFWVLLSFRDISPVGLNASIGASETKEEYKDPQALIGREFCEEIVVLSGVPEKGAEVTQRDFMARDGFKRFLNPGFANQHAALRREDDEFVITPVRNPARRLKFLDTPFSVEITFHGSNLEDTRETLEDVIYTINPAEFGIEIIKLVEFSVDDQEYIIDGEVNPSPRSLIRQIPILLKLNYLSDVFSKNGSLGILQRTGPSIDGKLMDEIPSEHCVVFDADVRLRKCRRDKILLDLATNVLDSSRRRNLEWELKRIVGWLERWDEAIGAAKRDGLKGDAEPARELRTLCPVTWKALELAFAHKLFQPLLDEEARMMRHVTSKAKSTSLHF